MSPETTSHSTKAGMRKMSGVECLSASCWWMLARCSAVVLCLAAVAIVVAEADAQCEIAKLVAADGDAGDYFGSDVAIHGSIAVVGAPGDDQMDLNAGAAYVYRLVEGEWVEEEKLLAPDGAELRRRRARRCGDPRSKRD